MPSLQSLKHKSSSTSAPMLAKLSMLQGAQAMDERTAHNLFSCPPSCWLRGYTPIHFVTGNTGVQKSVAPFSQVPLPLCQVPTAFHAEHTAGMVPAPLTRGCSWVWAQSRVDLLVALRAGWGSVWNICPLCVHSNSKYQRSNAPFIRVLNIWLPFFETPFSPLS